MKNVAKQKILLLISETDVKISTKCPKTTVYIKKNFKLSHNEIRFSISTLPNKFRNQKRDRLHVCRPRE